MPFLGSKNCHEACAVRIQKYLEKNGRALARDFVNLHGKEEQRIWSYFMDKTRAICGNDRAWGGKRAVTYTHFVISPDPRDGVGLEMLRELTLAWVHENFGDENERGRLGSYEVAIVYHDDNANHIPHAHVIVNNTDLDTGRRLQIDNKTNEEILPDRLQKLAEQRGLRYFDRALERELALDKEQAQKRGRFFTKEERALLRESKFSWKQDLANMIQIARRTSRSADEFLSRCEELGVGVREKEGDWIFTHPNNPRRWKASGRRLGKAYSKSAILDAHDGDVRALWEASGKTIGPSYAKDGIESDIRKDARLGAPRSPQVSQNVINSVMVDFFEKMDIVAIAERSVEIRDVAKTLQTNDRYSIRCYEDYGRVEARLRTSLGIYPPDDENAMRVLSAIDDVHSAKEIAEHGSFFIGVEREVGRTSTAENLPQNGSGSGRRKAGKARAANAPTRMRQQTKPGPQMPQQKRGGRK